MNFLPDAGEIRWQLPPSNLTISAYSARSGYPIL